MINENKRFWPRAAHPVRRLSLVRGIAASCLRRASHPSGLAALAIAALGVAGVSVLSPVNTGAELAPVAIVDLSPAGGFANAPQPLPGTYRIGAEDPVARSQLPRAEAPGAAPQLTALYRYDVDRSFMPHGLRLITGRPAAVPPPRPENNAVARLRPQARPGAVAPSRIETPADVLRPAARPLDYVALALPVTKPPRPTARPEGMTATVMSVPSHAASAMSRPAAAIRPNARPEIAVQRVAMAAMPRGPVAGHPTDAAPRGKTAAACSVRLARGIPQRPRGAAGGSALAERMRSLQGVDRDRLIAQELLSGNMPGFLRNLTPVTVSGRMPDGRGANVTICVTPDYLALGRDTDFLRVPMGLPAAAQIADRFGFLLPTTRMVDAIYAQAGLRLDPRPMTPGAQMTSTSYFWQHHQTVEGQTGGRAGQLVAGQKKDLVLTNRLRRTPGRVAIYGWHRPNGRPIQPLSTVHGALYADYSHGVRLVSDTAFVDGRAVSLGALLADPAYGAILSDEGPIPAPERLIASLYR
ncbi:hypothetical protein [Rhodovulum bhavnagarense]|nr:hypothetical protein [Rhodovulum bhavnagarense]